MTAKEFFQSPFRVFYVVDWSFILSLVIAGVILSILYTPVLLIVTGYGLLMVVLINLPFVSRKVRYTQDWKVFGTGIYNANKRMWTYFRTLDDEWLAKDMIEGD